ncbi:MAG TPA: helix-turn-helix domain-containing protein [Gaiellaceae bacterium]
MFEIGNSLREARVRQGLEYPQIELATKIRAKYIRALEDEHFGVLPAHTYVKGFLRTYAEFLGLDGQLYVDEFSSRFFGDGLEDSPRRVAPRVHQDRGIERKVLVLALAGIAALTALVIVAWKFGGSDSGTPPVVTQRSSTPPASSSPGGLLLTGVQRGTYVVVRRGSATGAVLLEATLARGMIQRVDGKRFWLYVRRASGVRVSLGGKAVSLPAGRNLKVLVTPKRTARAGA